MNEPHPIRNKRDAPRALSELRARLQDDARRGFRADFGERLRMEAKSAMEWEESYGWRENDSENIFDDAQEVPGGNEHRVFQTRDGKRAIKITNPPGFGAEGELLSYLDNLVLNNYLHGDDILVETFLKKSGGLQVVVTLPWIQGSPAPEDEIELFMKSRGIEPTRSHAWHSPELGIRIFDARPANIFKELESGMLIPIDVHIKSPPDVLEEAWREQQIREAEGSCEA